MIKFIYNKQKVYRILNNYLNHPLLRIGLSFDEDGDIGYVIESEYRNIELYSGHILDYKFLFFNSINSKTIKNILKYSTLKKFKYLS